MKFKTIKKIAAIIVVIAIIVNMAFAWHLYTADTTTVSIDPPSQTVSPGDTFTIDVSCAPTWPIDRYQFHLSFDSSLLQASLVTEGNIFDGLALQFNETSPVGSINNTAGTIIFYNMLSGPGMVSNEVTLATISFTALEAVGTSTLSLSHIMVNAGVGYKTAKITINDGEITIQ